MNIGKKTSFAKILIEHAVCRLQCMSCGTPVIGADSGGPRDFVSEDVGRLVPESSVSNALSHDSDG